MPVHTYEFVGIKAVYASPVMVSLLERARRFAQLDEAVLIEGESGSGKEIVARALHSYSPRAAKSLVDVNCAALPDNLLESELFGFDRGAFSGAHASKPGLFELANGGTLFLDEIGELDLKLQAKLLRVLDSQEFFRLGGTQKVRVNVKILAATNQNLDEAVRDKRFRRDLYYRLIQLRLHVPPLRERREDILPIADLFRERYRLSAAFSPAAAGALLRYHWPGNLRELKSVVVACAANLTGDEIAVGDLPPSLREPPPFEAPVCDLLNLFAGVETELDTRGTRGLLETAEKLLILKTLRLTTGNQERAASMLGISTRTLARKLKAYAEGVTAVGENSTGETL